MSVLCLCHNEAMHFAAQELMLYGLTVTEEPSAEIRHLLLPVPSTSAMAEALSLLPQLPEDVIVSGGFLDVPSLGSIQTVDFLKDEIYLAENAAITARCAQKLAERVLGRELGGQRVLVLGWGRIGKCLARLLRECSCDTVVAARQPRDLAILHALGYHVVPIAYAGDIAAHCRAIFNTVPEMVLPELRCGKNCAAFELASRPGMAGGGIVSARGLPGRMAPSESGRLIARTFIRKSLGGKT